MKGLPILLLQEKKGLPIMLLREKKEMKAGQATHLLHEMRGAKTGPATLRLPEAMIQVGQMTDPAIILLPKAGILVIHHHRQEDLHRVATVAVRDRQAGDNHYPSNLVS